MGAGVRWFRRWLNRIRLARAESELAFLEARAPAEINRQRARVASLRLQVRADTRRPPLDIITSTHRIEIAQKRDEIN